eukprot:gene14597-31067_t
MFHNMADSKYQTVNRNGPKSQVHSKSVVPPQNFTKKPSAMAVSSVSKGTGRNGPGTLPVDVNNGNEDFVDTESKSNYKTTLCRYGKHCLYGERCSFAHSDTELRCFSTSGKPINSPITNNLPLAEPPGVSLPPKPFIMQAEDFPDLPKPVIKENKEKDENHEHEIISTCDTEINIGNSNLNIPNSNHMNMNTNNTSNTWGKANSNMSQETSSICSESSLGENESSLGLGYLCASLTSPFQLQQQDILNQHHSIIPGQGHGHLSSQIDSTSMYFSSLLESSSMETSPSFSLATLTDDRPTVTLTSSVTDQLMPETTSFFHFLSSTSSTNSTIINSTNNNNINNIDNNNHNNNITNNNINNNHTNILGNINLNSNSNNNNTTIGNSNSNLNLNNGIDSDIVPPKTFPTVEWLRLYNMAIYMWSGNDRAWTEFAMHVPNIYINQINSILPELIQKSTCQMWIDYDYLKGSYESFLIMRRGENGESSNFAMNKALEIISNFFNEILLYSKQDGNGIGNNPGRLQRGLSLPSSLPLSSPSLIMNNQNTQY